jgi:hypothetical protein
MPRRRRKGRSGPKSKYTPDTALRIGIALGRRPRSILDAANNAEVPKTTFYRWVKRGDNGDPLYALLARTARPPKPRPVNMVDLLRRLHSGLSLPSI